MVRQKEHLGELVGEIQAAQKLKSIFWFMVSMTDFFSQHLKIFQGFLNIHSES